MSKKSTLTSKQIKAKLASMLYSFDDGSIYHDLLEDGYLEADAEDTELEPYVKNAKVALEQLVNKFDSMCEQYGLYEITEDELDDLIVDSQLEE